MSTTSITLTRQTVEQMIPATFDKNKGFFSLVTVNWTEQMFYELPTITVELYIKNGTTDTKTPLFSRVIKTYNPNTKTIESWEHTRNVIDVPESCYLKIIPNFDNNAVSARNSLIENGIEEGELWETSTAQFPIILSIGEEAGGTEQTIEGQPPISFISTTTSLIDWTLYGNSIQNGTPTPTSPKPVLGCGDYYETEPELKTLTGVPPFTINTDGTSIETWSLDGNSQQTGTPAPDAPIMPQFVGERTGNLFSGYDIPNQIPDSTGALIPAPGGGTTSLIPITNGDIFMSGITTSTEINFWLYLYAADKTYVGRAKSIGNGETTGVAGNIIEGYANAKYARVRLDILTSAVAPTNVMLNTGSTPLPYEPYGFKLPITSAGQTVPVYLGQVQTLRRIKKLLLTGGESEDWQYNSQYGVMYGSFVSDYFRIGAIICSSTHFEAKQNVSSISQAQSGVSFMVSNQYDRIYIKNSQFYNVNTFRQWLADQYANGIPVTVWYVLAEPTAGITNEPIAKIGDYVDTLTSDQAGITLPTIKGTTTVTVDTTILPSNMSITYYEQFQKYIIPITNRSNTQTIDLSTVQSNRKIKKLVLTGQENWLPGTVFYELRITQSSEYVNDRNDIICTHFVVGEYSGPLSVGQIRATGAPAAGIAFNYDGTGNNLDEFKQWLVDQYANGTPVTVWYVLATSQTTTVNEPLMKIGDYTDVLEGENSGITIPIQKGLNTIDVNTTLKPSNIQITYQ